MKSSLQNKLLYSFIGVVILVLLCVSVGMSFLIRNYFYTSKQKELIAKGHELARVVNEYNSGNINDNQFTEFINSVDSFLDARVWVLDNSSQLLAVSTPRRGTGVGQRTHQGMGRKMFGARHNVISGFEEVFSGKVMTKTFFHPDYEEKMLTAAVPVISGEGKIGGAVILHAPVSGINDFLQIIYYYIAATGTIAIFLTIVLAMWLSKSIVKPVLSMQKAASAMAGGDYLTRVQVTSNDEIGQLGHSLNELAADLHIFIEKQEVLEKMRRDFVANVSHELRTPLTIIRGYNEALADGTIEAADMKEKYHNLIREEIMRLERLIKDLLDLSKLQSGAGNIQMEEIPLNNIVESIGAKIKQKAESKNINLILELTSVPKIQGSGDRITQLVLILADNAVKYTFNGGTVNLKTYCSDDKVVLEITDSGIGIPQEELPFIWERFYKVDKSHAKTTEGTGLGLAIAKEIIDLHKAEVEVDSKFGVGTTFKVKFAVPEK